MVRNLPEMWKTGVQSLGWEDALKKEKATHSSILTWIIPTRLHAQRSLVGCSPWGVNESDMTK